MSICEFFNQIQSEGDFLLTIFTRKRIAGFDVDFFNKIRSEGESFLTIFPSKRIAGLDVNL